MHTSTIEGTQRPIPSLLGPARQAIVDAVERLVAEAAVALRLRCVVERGDLVCAGQRQLKVRRKLAREAQILCLQVDAKVWRVVARDDERPVVLQNPRGSRAAEQRFANLGEVDAVCARERERLAYGLDVQRADDLVAELYRLASAARTEVSDRLAERLEHGAGARES